MDTPLHLDSENGALRLVPSPNADAASGARLQFASRDDARDACDDLAAIPGNLVGMRRALGWVRPPWDVLTWPDAEVIEQLAWALSEEELALEPLGSPAG